MNKKDDGKDRKGTGETEKFLSFASTCKSWVVIVKRRSGRKKHVTEGENDKAIG